MSVRQCEGWIVGECECEPYIVCECWGRVRVSTVIVCECE